MCVDRFNPCSHIILLFIGGYLKNEVDLCMNFGFAPKSNPFTPIYWLILCFLWSESYESVSTRDYGLPIMLVWI